VDTVRDLSSSGDLDMISAIDYIDSARWLPYATGRTLIEAMSNLEAILAALPADQLARSSGWCGLVFDAIDRLRLAEYASKDYGEISSRLSPLPSTFEEALMRAQDAPQS
jgi:hypothetical protein